MLSATEGFARSLHLARITGASVAPLTLADSTLDIPAAYAIQSEGLKLRLGNGEHIVGAKLGLTSRAKQLEVGFDQPVHAWLTDAMQVANEVLDVSMMRMPRVEPELALFLGRDLDHAHETPDSLLQAIAMVAPAIEVLNSRYPVNAPSLPDVVADGASAAAFAVGQGIVWDGTEEELNQLHCRLMINGQVVAAARALEALGGPVHALMALNGAMANSGTVLAAGAVILTGGLTRAFPISPGDRIDVSFDAPVGTVSFSARHHREGVAR